MAKKSKQSPKSKISSTSKSFRTKCKTHTWYSDWYDTEAKAIDSAKKHKNEFPTNELHSIKLDIKINS